MEDGSEEGDEQREDKSKESVETLDEGNDRDEQLNDEFARKG